MTQRERAEKFRALHTAGTFVIPNPWDAGSARILAGLGFEALATTSGGFALSLGRLDGVVARAEVLAHCRAVAEAVELPVAADLENGFGDDPKTVAETIRLAAATGIVGASIEDAAGNGSIYDLALAVERVAAAVEAARALSFPFTLTARAENFLHGRAELDDTLRRLEAFAKAGADVLFAPGLPTLDAIRAACAAVSPRPVNALAGMKGVAFPVADLAAAGVRRISLGAALSRAAYGSMIAAAREIREHGTFSFVADTAPMSEFAPYLIARR